jgi:hypothetical protein
MHLNTRATFVKNVSAAAVNGTVTLIILLIAPLGLAAVIVNTLLVALSTFMVGMAGDWIVVWLISGSRNPINLQQGPYRPDVSELAPKRQNNPDDYR